MAAQDVGQLIGVFPHLLPKEKKEIEAWQSLVHVCRRWRSVAFGSPRRLNLRLVCTSGTLARDMLDVWPTFPLLVWADVVGSDHKDLDNIIAVLEHGNRIHEIKLSIYGDSAMEKVWVAMQGPFPELTILELQNWPHGEMLTVVPDSFLGGSSERLRELQLHHIPFPGLPKLLLSATHLVNLDLQAIPHSGYISPTAIATAISTLTSLQKLYLTFQSPQSRPDWQPPPLTRFILPVLTCVVFEGVSEYIDDLVSRIDAPRLNYLGITFFNQIVFDTPQFMQFVSRTPMLKLPEEARITFTGDTAYVRFSSQTSRFGKLEVDVRCMELDWLVSSMEQVCTSCLPPLSTLEDLYIKATDWKSDTQDNIENALWLELLQPFIAVKNLYLSEEVTPRILPALQELVGGGTTEVLPAPQNIFLRSIEPSGPVQESIGKFVAARQGSVAVSHWEGD